MSLDLYVMSQCPFGVKAENAIFPAVRSLAPLVTFHLYFIANEAPGATGVAEFKSLHGQPEVEEDIRHLCAQKHFPKLYMDFILERNLNIRDAGWQGAATKVGIDPAAIEQCSTGDEGKQLLSESIKVSQKRQANASPTIDVNQAQYRGGRSLRSVTLGLCDALQAKGVPLPAACEQAKKLPVDPTETAGGCGPSGGSGGGPAPRPNVAFGIQVVTDPTCAICAPTLLDVLKQRHPKATVKTIAADSNEGQALIKQFHAEALPFYLLDQAVEQEPAFSVLSASAYVKIDNRPTLRAGAAGGYRYTIRPGPDTYTPSVQLTRAREPQHLDVLVESLSPFTAQMEAELIRAVTDSAASHLTLSFHYLVQESTAAQAPPAAGALAKGKVRAASVKEVSRVTPGPLTSRRGEEELQESLRQICLFQHASVGEFFVYLKCRDQDLLDLSRAETCLAMTPEIQRCIIEGEGERLLRQDAALIRDLGLRNGPALLWENRYGPFGWHEVDWRSVIEQAEGS